MLGGPDTVAADAGDTVFIDAGDTVVVDDSRYDDPAGGHQPGSTTRHASDHRPQPLEREIARPHGKAVKTTRRSPVLVWLGVAVVAVVVSAAGLRWAQSSKAPQDDIITEMAEPPAAPPPAVMETALQDPAAAASAAVDGAASDTVAAASMPAPALVPASAPRAPTRARRAAPEPAPTPIVVHEEPPPPPPPVVTEPKPRPPPPRVPSPQEACADANFLARPMCIHQECQKPSQANQPICVENRRRYEADEQRRRQTPN